MRRANILLTTIFIALATAAFAQTSVPAYSGTWKLDLKRSKLETKHPPSSSTATIHYDGTEWKFSRTHHFPNKPADTWSSTTVVDAKQPKIAHEPHMTITTRLTLQGNQIVLREDYAADTGETGSNTVHYRLEDKDNTLIEDEVEVSPDGTEHNTWVLTRISPHK